MHQPPIPQIDAEDPEIATLIHDEAHRQADKFRLIPSENYVSVAVLEACGTVLTNKYSEGYPGKRYYEGQQFIDPIESIAISRAEALFGVDPVSYTHLRAHETRHDLVCRLLLET